MSKELEAMKGIKQAIAEHLHKQTGVSVEKHFEYLQYDTEIEVVTNALNELERLKKFKETFDNYELAKKQDFIAYENWLECEAELKKTPTEDEVIKALSDYLKDKVIYNDRFGFICNDRVIICLYPNNVLSFNKNYPAHIHNIVGRFYESLEGEN